MDLGQGAVLQGRYELRALLASGGMGALWQATDRGLGREVAVKLMRGHLHLDQVSRERFRREAEILAGLSHPGITVIHDYGHHDGQPFIVMELLAGRDLYRMMVDNPGGLPAARALDLAAQAAAALAAAHQAGVLHRDIKPSNLFVARKHGPPPGDQLKVCDFGVAKAVGTAAITSAGQLLGTHAYQAPELWQGDPATARSDLYALGCVLHEVLAGQPPFRVDLSASALREQHLRTIPAPPRGARPVPPPLAGLTVRLLSKDPARRPGSAAELGEELRAIAGCLNDGRPPAGPLPRLATPAAHGAHATPPLPHARPVAARPGWPPPGAAARHAPPPGPAVIKAAPGTLFLARELAPAPPARLAPPARPAPPFTAPTPPFAAAGPPRPGPPAGGREHGLAAPWDRATRISAWALFAIIALLCVGIAAGGWAGLERLFVLGPAAAYTLAGALAVRRVAAIDERAARLALSSFSVAALSAILLTGQVGPVGLWAALLTLSWLSGLLLATARRADK